MKRTQQQRFWEKVNKNGPVPEHRPGLGNCWTWTASLSTYGYGSFDGRSAHIFSFLWSGQVVPEGKELDHLCRNRCCVRPSHLEPVTCRENILRGVGTAAINARKTHCVRGHPFDEANTYKRKTGRACRKCCCIRTSNYFRRRMDAKKEKSSKEGQEIRR